MQLMLEWIVASDKRAAKEIAAYFVLNQLFLLEGDFLRKTLGAVAHADYE